MISKAKINLFLHVTGKINNMHRIESVACFANKIYDEIKIEPHHEKTINSNIADNIIWKAVNLLERKFNKSFNIKVSIIKNIPIEAGLGGGSGNAAAAIKLIKELYSLPLNKKDIKEISKELGADVFLCYQEEMSFCQGIGDQLNKYNLNEEIFILLVNNGTKNSTKKIFSPSFTHFTPNITTLGNSLKFLKSQKNDLETRVKSISHLIYQEEQCQFARMTGSGSTCFGVFTDLEAMEIAQENLQRKHPNWWIKPTSIC